MNSNNEHSIPYDLLIKHLSGQTSQDEMKTIEEWLNKDPENQNIFDQLKDTWNSLDHVADILDIDLDEEWIRQQRTIIFKKPIENKRNSKIIFWKVSKIAAIFLVIFAAIATFYTVSPSFNQKKIFTANSVQSLELPDGTHVTLNANTTLKYPKQFKEGVRKIFLEGEAYFEVYPDSVTPFIISAREAIIEVLGTSFNVDAYDQNESITIVVSTGTVAFYIPSNPTEQIILQKGNTGILIKDNQSMIKKTNTDENFLAWKTKRIVFENEMLDNVIRILEDVYHARILINNPSLKNCRITATFNQQSLKSVLKVIEETLDIEIDEVDNILLIDGKGCD